MSLVGQWTRFMVAVLLASPLPAGEVRIYVAPHGNDRQDGSEARPLASLAAAQQRVREQVAAGRPDPITVVIAPGNWTLSEPLVFDHRDASLQTPVTYQASPAGSVVLGGGETVTSWQREGDFWVADRLPRSAAGNKPRRLMVAGRPAPCAREPDAGWYRVALAGADRRTTFQYDPDGFVESEKPTGVELVFLHDWSSSRVRLQRLDAAGRQLVFQSAIGGELEFFAIDGFEPHARYALENDRAFADTPGEWYFDHDLERLYILAEPLAKTPPLVRLPQLANLVRIEGTADQPVRGLTLQGLTFSDTGCDLPALGGAEVQAGFFQPRGESGPGAEGLVRLAPAVELGFAEDCAIRDCRFENLGGGGIYVCRQSHRNRIEACSFANLGGTAVMLGDTNPSRDSEGTQLVCRDNRLVDSRISNCGQVLQGSVGVWVGIAAATRIENNEISQLPYTGISVGWQWNAEPTGCCENLVVGNRISEVMQLLSDGGGIYTLGRQPGTVLRDNRIRDVPVNAGRAESNGIFMDEGSSLILVTGNEISGIARAPIRFHKARELTVRGNRLWVAPGNQPFTYNATDPAAILTAGNEIAAEPQR